MIRVRYPGCKSFFISPKIYIYICMYIYIYRFLYIYIIYVYTIMYIHCRYMYFTGQLFFRILPDHCHMLAGMPGNFYTSTLSEESQEDMEELEAKNK